MALTSEGKSYIYFQTDSEGYNGRLRLLNRFSSFRGWWTVRREILRVLKTNFNTSYRWRHANVLEGDGVDYFFRTREEFEELIPSRQMLDAEYVGNHGGTLWPMSMKPDKGIDVFLEIEVQALQVEKGSRCCLYLPDTTRFGWIARSLGRSWNRQCKWLPNESKSQGRNCSHAWVWLCDCQRSGALAERTNVIEQNIRGSCHCTIRRCYKISNYPIKFENRYKQMMLKPHWYLSTRFLQNIHS